MKNNITYDEYLWVLRKFYNFYVNRRSDAIAFCNRYGRKDEKDAIYWKNLNDSYTYDVIVGLLGNLIDIYSSYDEYLSWKKTLNGNDYL